MPRKPLLVLLIVVILTMSSCSSKEKPVLKIGMNVEFPPFGYIVDGAYAGIDVDLSHKIAEKMGHPYKIINIEFENMIAAINSGKVDFAISAMSITEERSRILEFSQPYFQVDQSIIVLEDTPISIENEYEIGSYKVGVQNSTTSQTWVQEELRLKNLIDNDNIFTFANNTEAIEALVSGEIDLVVIDDSAARGFAQNYPISTVYRIVTGEEYGIAMPKNGEYNAKIKAALEDLIISGELSSILQTHGYTNR